MRINGAHHGFLRRITRALTVLAAGAAVLAAATPADAQTTASDEKIIVSGASARLGGLTVKELLARGVPASRLILVSRTPDERAIDAAKAAGVEHIAYTSYVGLTRGDLVGLAANHQRTEDLLKASGVGWTMLRNSIYMDGLVSQAARMNVRALFEANKDTLLGSAR